MFNRACRGYRSPVETKHSLESSELVYCLWLWKIANCTDVVHAYSFITKYTLVGIYYNTNLANLAKSSFKCSIRSSSQDKAARISSIYTYAKFNPRSTSSMILWNVCVALRKPNVIIGNSNRPNGVKMAVFAMSSLYTGIWWLHALSLSLKKMFFLRNLRYVESGMCQGRS